MVYLAINFKLKVDILTAICDTEEKRHVLAALPTGFGKTLPQLLCSSLLSEGYVNVFFYSSTGTHVCLDILYNNNFCFLRGSGSKKHLSSIITPLFCMYFTMKIVEYF